MSGRRIKSLVVFALPPGGQSGGSRVRVTHAGAHQPIPFQPSRFRAVLGVLSNIPVERGESLLGRASRFARQSASASPVVPYTRSATSSIVSADLTSVNAERTSRAGLDRSAVLVPAGADVLAPAGRDARADAGLERVIGEPEASPAGDWPCRPRRASSFESNLAVTTPVRSRAVVSPTGRDDGSRRTFVRVSATPLESSEPEAESMGALCAGTPAGRSHRPPQAARGLRPFEECRAETMRPRRSKQSRQKERYSVQLDGSWLSVRKGVSLGAKLRVVIVKIGSTGRRLESVSPRRKRFRLS